MGLCTMSHGHEEQNVSSELLRDTGSEKTGVQTLKVNGRSRIKQ